MKNFYDDKYYGGTGKGTMTKRRRRRLEEELIFLQSLFAPKPDEKLLDIGCGGGGYIACLQEKGVDVWGIDISENITTLAKKRVKKPEQIICADGIPLPFNDNTYDYVTAWGVIEHFPSIPSILEEIKRVIKPNGTAAIMVPNSYYYKFILDTFRHGTGPVRHQEIEFLYSFKEWKQLIEAAGLRVQNVERHNKFNKTGFLRWVRSILIPFYFSNHFVYLCTK